MQADGSREKMVEKPLSKLNLLGSVEQRVKIALAEYGEKAEKVLRAAIERCRELEESGVARLGDFDYRGIKRKLAEMSFKYNPSLLLRVLEREYMIIETSYRSSNQHWWVFVDREAVERALGEEKQYDDSPEITLLRTQYKVLQPKKLLDTLIELSSKRKLSEMDKRMLRKIVFDDLNLVVELLKKMRDLEDVFQEEISVLGRIISVASKVADRL